MVGDTGLGFGSAGLNVSLSCASCMTGVSHLNYDFSFSSWEIKTATHLCCPFKRGTEINLATERVICEVTQNRGLLASTVDQDGVITCTVNQERVITDLCTHF